MASAGDEDARARGEGTRDATCAGSRPTGGLGEAAHSAGAGRLSKSRSEHRGRSIGDGGRPRRVSGR